MIKTLKGLKHRNQNLFKIITEELKNLKKVLRCVSTFNAQLGAALKGNSVQIAAFKENVERLFKEVIVLAPLAANRGGALVWGCGDFVVLRLPLTSARALNLLPALKL